MALDLYFAGGLSKYSDELLIARDGNRLFSQKFERGRIGKTWTNYVREHPEFRGKVFVDSSAYGAWTRSLEIDIDDYIDYLNENEGCFSVIASLDVIPGDKGHFATRQQVISASETSWENYLYMYERVLDKDRVIPVFHVGEPWEYLDKILAYSHLDGSKIQYIGLGGLVGVNSNDRIKWLSRVFDIIKGSSNPEIKTHAFGVTALHILEQFPFASADSTSAVMTAAMGSIMTPYGDISFAKKEGGADKFRRLGKPIQDSILKLIEESGLKFTIDEIADSLYVREAINCQYLLDWVDSYTYNPPKHKQLRLF